MNFFDADELVLLGPLANVLCGRGMALKQCHWPDALLWQLLWLSQFLERHNH